MNKKISEVMIKILLSWLPSVPSFISGDNLKKKTAVLTDTSTYVIIERYLQYTFLVLLTQHWGIC